MKPTRLAGLVHASNTYFVTSQTEGRRAFLQSDRSASLVIEILYARRSEGTLALHAFVIMPDHFHLLITPAAGVALKSAMKLFKGRASYEAGVRFGRLGELWQRGFTDHRIRDHEDYVKHVEYIHMNPVRKGQSQTQLSTLTAPHIQDSNSIGSSLLCDLSFRLRFAAPWPSAEWKRLSARFFFDTASAVPLQLAAGDMALVEIHARHETQLWARARDLELARPQDSSRRPRCKPHGRLDSITVYKTQRPGSGRAFAVEISEGYVRTMRISFQS